MANATKYLVWIAALPFLLANSHAQAPQQTIQQLVDAERAANKNDHTHWIYFQDTHTPKEHVLQWVAGSQQGDVRRILEKDNQILGDPQQRDLIQKFLHDPKAQSKLIEENNHDYQQVDDLLKLLPEAFFWTQTAASETSTTLHYEPNPNFRPPTRESRVFAAMTGDLVMDNQQHRIRSMSGHLIHDVTFGGGLLGRLKQGSSFSLEQTQVGPSIWELTAIHVKLDGNALLFKSISLQQDDVRSKYEPEPANITLEQAAEHVMHQPSLESVTLKIN